MTLEELMESDIGLEFDSLFEPFREIIITALNDFNEIRIDGFYRKALRRYVKGRDAEELYKTGIFRSWLFDLLEE